MRRVNLANWVLRTSPKFTTGLNINSIRVFDQIRNPEIPITLRPPLQPFHHFTYITTHSPTIPSLYLRHSSFSNLSVASPTSQFILQPFFRFFYVTSSSLNSPGKPPMVGNFLSFKLDWIYWLLVFTRRRRVIGISWSLIWSKTLMEVIFNPCDEFRGSPESPVRQIHSPHLHVVAPAIFADLLRSVQMLKREWGVESNGKLPHLFSPW